MKNRKLYVFILCCLFAVNDLVAQKFRTGIGLSALTPIIKYVSYSTNTKANPGFGIMVKEEFNFLKNIGVVVRVEYQNWGIEFDGTYYEYPDHLGNVGLDKYHHKIRVNEIQIPLIIKFDTDSLFKKASLYVFGGYLLRYSFTTQTKITSNINDQLLQKGTASLRYRGGWDIREHTIVAGFGVDFKLFNNKQDFYSEFNYNHMLDYFLYNGKEGAISNDLIFRIYSIGLTFGMYF